MLTLRWCVQPACYKVTYSVNTRCKQNSIHHKVQYLVLVVQVHPSQPIGRMGIVGPYPPDRMAPHCWHLGVGLFTPNQTVGTETGPPHREQVPIIISFM